MDGDGRAGAALEQLVRARVERCNEGDWVAVRAMTGPGYAYCEAGSGRRIDDLDDVLGALQRWRVAAPDMRAAVRWVHAEADLTVADVVWSATLAQRKLCVADRVWARWVDRRLVAEWHEVGILSLVAPLVDDEPAAPAQAAAPRR
jgi:hypothetical protein